MKNIAAFFLALALPAALCAQQGKLSETKLPDGTVKTSTSAAKPAQAAEIIPVIQPGPAKTKSAAPAKAEAKPAPAAAKQAPAKSKLAAALSGEAKPPAAAGAKAPAAAKPAPAPAKPAARPSPASAGLVVKPGAPRVQPNEKRSGGFAVGKKHTVIKGDTLWDLSGKYYKNPFMWGRIYNANMKTVADPDRINPREELYIPDLEEILTPYRRPAVPLAAAPAKAAEAEDEADGGDYPAAAGSRKASVALSGVVVPGEILKDFEDNFLSEEMPEDQTEWGSGTRIVPDSWREDGVITAKLKNDDDFLGDGLSVTGELLEITLEAGVSVRPGDYLAIYMKGTESFDKEGNRVGREVQPAGLAEVFTVEDGVAKARVIDAATAIYKGYIVKKK